MTNQKKDVYEMVTDRIITMLEQGLIPWTKPWTGVTDGAYNRVSKKPYSLLNQMLLKHKGEYASFKQWTDLGAKIRKGEKSEFVVFYKMLEKKEVNADGEEVVTTIPLLRYLPVFHISQVDGIEPLQLPEQPVTTNETLDKVFNDYVTREHITFIETVSDEAYYSPTRDMVVVPLKSQFKNTNEWYETTGHELAHSTMKKNRCNREEDRKGNVVAFGSDEYSKEELVAEISSATMMNMFGLETEASFRNNVAYIQSWIRVLKNDKRMIVSASTKADKAVKYILGE